MSGRRAGAGFGARFGAGFRTGLRARAGLRARLGTRTGFRAGTRTGIGLRTWVGVVTLVNKVNQPVKSFIEGSRIQGMHTEFIQFGHGCLKIFKFIESFRIFSGHLPVKAAVDGVCILHQNSLRRTVGKRLGTVGRCVMDGNRI